MELKKLTYHVPGNMSNSSAHYARAEIRINEIHTEVVEFDLGEGLSAKMARLNKEIYGPGHRKRALEIAASRQ